jgi:putative redox protein
MEARLMQARVEWIGKRSFVGTSGSNHALVMGAKYGEEPAPGPSPMELVLLGLGGCTAFDVVHILEKSRAVIEGVEAELSAERASQDPQVFTSIHIHFIVRGKGISPAKVERAIELSAEKYCSASAMLRSTAKITHDFEVKDESAAGAR